MQYPTKVQLELALKGLAAEIGEVGTTPFRVDVLGMAGGRPPTYNVVILSPDKARLREKLAGALDRPLGLSSASIVLRAPEALKLVSVYNPYH